MILPRMYSAMPIAINYKNLDYEIETVTLLAYFEMEV